MSKVADYCICANFDKCCFCDRVHVRNIPIGRGVRMYENWTESAKQVLFFGTYEATQLGAIEIGPEHILLGLIRRERHRMFRQILEKDSKVSALNTSLREQIKPNSDDSRSTSPIHRSY